ncbi:hypothetical protein GCM10022200_22920 [Microbacterium awajiense]|uniref:MinD-like ATPase involved in chromosome partitioning or flagellar assembly n=1 Tax=Microbacterium awajiense TaxID=415214 RepID=A0ABP7ASK3_9MICO
MTVDLRELPATLFTSAAASARALTAWDAAIRGPRSTAQRIGVMSLSPGAGGSTLAEQIVRTAAARRSEPVLAVDVSAATTGLGARLGIPVTGIDDTRAVARTSSDAQSGLASGAGWFGLRTDSGHAVDAWLAEAAPITRFFEVSVTDFGVRHPLVDLAPCAALCDVVVLVADARRGPAELARAAAPAIAALPEAPRPVLALVDHARAGDAVARALATDPYPVVGVPFDAGLRGGSAARTARARRALLRLSATAIGAQAVPA